jgi:hypothetical protein
LKNFASVVAKQPTIHSSEQFNMGSTKIMNTRRNNFYSAVAGFVTMLFFVMTMAAGHTPPTVVASAPTPTITPWAFPTTIKLSVYKTEMNLGQSNRITAYVTGMYGQYPEVNTGKVAFYSGEKWLGSAAVDEHGYAYLAFTPRVSGSYILYAIYQGGPANNYPVIFSDSQSDSITIIVN